MDTIFNIIQYTINIKYIYKLFIQRSILVEDFSGGRTTANFFTSIPQWFPKINPFNTVHTDMHQ